MRAWRATGATPFSHILNAGSIVVRRIDGVLPPRHKQELHTRTRYVERLLDADHTDHGRHHVFAFLFLIWPLPLPVW